MAATRKAAPAGGQRARAGGAGGAGRTGPVGREDVLARLRRAVDEAITGPGQVVLLTGEAGIGKTTMLAEAARYAQDRGARVAWGWGWPAEGAPGYWPWVQVIRALRLGGPLSGDPALALARAAADEAPGSARFQLFDEVTSLLLAESRIQPLVIILDDLHWADRSSLLLLDFLARRLLVGSATVLGAYRDVGAPGTQDGGAEPGSALAGLTAPSTVLPLAGLTVDAVEQLIASVTGARPGPAAAADVCERTGGNPFFVEQLSWLMRAGGSGVPPGAREMLAERFSALTPGCAATVSAAAVIGQRFSAELAATAAGQTPEGAAAGLAEAVRAGLLVPSGPGSFRFTHDLFREYAAERLPGDQLARLHQRVGDALEAERAHGGEASLAELAGHFTRADPGSEKAYHYGAAAAAEATARLAYDEAAGHWEGALAAVGPGAPRRIETLLRLAEAQWRAGHGSAAAEAYARAAGLARREHDGIGLAQAALGLQAIGVRSWWPPDELVALLSEALDALPEADGPHAGETEGPDRTAPRLLRLRVMASLARTLAWHGRDPARARTLAAAAVAAARAAGDLPTLAICLLAQHNAIWSPGTAEQRRQLAGDVAALAERTGDTELLIEARVLGVTDRLELASPSFRTELDEYLRLADASGQPRFRYGALVRRATLALLAGRLTDAERLIDQAFMLGQECGEPQAADVWSDQVWDLRTAQGRRAELQDISGTFPDPESRQARGFTAMTLLAAGHRDRAAQIAAPILAGSQAAGDDSFGVPPAGQLLDAAYGAELMAGLGTQGPAERLYQALAPFAGQAAVSGAAITFKGTVDHHLGVLAALLRRGVQAAAHLEQAVAAHHRLGALPWALRSRYELARIRLAEPARHDAAQTELADVARAAGQLGLAQLARDAAGAAEAAGQPPAAAGTFRRDGAIWTLSYAGATVRLRDAKGLADLAVLLAAPGQPVLAADLAAAAGAGDLARAALALGADSMLDETALRQIRARLTTLDEEIAEADQWSDLERAARARAEREALVSHLAAATGLGGRPRRLGDEGERARKTVTARIRDVIGKIEQSHPPLGAHLRASVTTGTRCTYSPPAPVSWQL